jgi:hypothetical protein
MPKYESKIVRQEELGPDGRVIKTGIVAWVPLNDAAKAHALSDKAVELGAYKRATPFERQEMERKLKEKEREAAASQIRRA